MLSDYLEAFTLLERLEEADGLGGQRVRWEEGETLSLALAPLPPARDTEGGRPAGLRRAHLLGSVRLETGDRLRREADGTLWRVEAGSGAYRTPATAWQTWWQAEVEEVRA